MFEQAMLSNVAPGKRVCAAGIGFAGQALLVSFLLLVPLLWPQVLPSTQAMMTLVLPPAPPPPPLKGAAAAPRSAHAAATPFEVRILVAPKTIPAATAMFADAPDIAVGVPGGVEIAVPGGIPTALMTVPVPLPKMEPAPVAPVTPEVKRAKLGGMVKMARLQRRVEPLYPVVAKTARVSGVVELTGIIGTDGRIRELHATSGNPLLVRAALDAVAQWVYEPTRLNGELIEVIAPITVTFRLN